MRNQTSMLAVVSSLAVAIGAHAVKADELSAESILAFRAKGGNGGNFVSAYVAGIIAGFESMNAQLAIDKKPMIYYQPREVTLTTPQVIDKMEKEVQEKPETGKLPARSVLLQSMIGSFPCKS